MATSADLPEVHQPAKRPWGKIITSLVIIALLAALGIGGWRYTAAIDDKNKAEASAENLRRQVDDLGKKLAAAKDEASKTASKSSGVTPCDPVVATATKANIKAAVASKNYAALEGYMASPSVNVVFAASEKGGGVTPAQAIVDLKYLDAATAPWDFALPAATLASYDSGDYAQYFDDNTYVGKSANNYVVSFDFDSCGKINVIFISLSADLLM